MAIVLAANNYGKAEVRLVKVVRTPGRHAVRDLTVNVALEGDFDAAHLEGDNTGLLATDTMRNTVYALAQGHDDVADVERFGIRLVEHFLAAGPTVTRARVRLAAHPWSRLTAGATPDPHAFQRGNGGDRIATVAGDAAGISVEAGIDGLVVLKTTGSGWQGYHRDEYTSLAETDDRIMATELTARWTYGAPASEIDFTASWEAVRAVVLETFGDHYSPSVQFTLHRMGDAVLEARPEVERISFSLPNRHHLLFDLSRFGLENDHEIFQATEEPYGLIEGTVERAPATGPAADNGVVGASARAGA